MPRAADSAAMASASAGRSESPAAGENGEHDDGESAQGWERAGGGAGAAAAAAAAAASDGEGDSANGASESEGEDTGEPSRTSSRASTESSKRKASRSKPSRGKKPKKVRKESVPFRLVSSLKEDHGHPIFGVQFNPFYEKQSDSRHIFAAVGGYRVTVYECTADGAIEVLQAYVDPDPKEEHYTCAWSYEPDTLQPLLAFAGRNGVIRMLKPAEFECKNSLIGHGQAINELRFHTIDPNLLLSMSADNAIRLWNCKTEVCVLILGGEKGHRDEVLSADFNIDCTKIVSCGMDHSLKIWDVGTPEARAQVELSYAYDRAATKRPFKARVQHFPAFSTRAVHRNYVDCTRWLGDAVLSKSTDEQIVCWKPGGPARLDLNEKRSQYLGDTVTVLQRFEVPKCEIWYLRFTVDPGLNVLAVGNQEGKVFVWNLKVPAGSARANRIALEARRCTSTVRQVAVSTDARILVAVCDDSTLWRWDRTERLEPSGGNADDESGSDDCGGTSDDDATDGETASP